jgi:hypothetical protein
MSEFLKGNFKTKSEVKVKSSQEENEDLQDRFRKQALGSIGGSMVYVERTALDWDGDED